MSIDDLYPGSVVADQFCVEERLGGGGMGVVYRATDLRYSRTVAIKAVGFAQADEFVEDRRRALEAESRILSILRHSALPQWFGQFETSDALIFVMEFVDGDDLRTVLRRRARPFDESDVREWARQILDVLEYLHSRVPPVLHRDIKPSNLKVNALGKLYLLDFGLAKAASATSATRSLWGYTESYAPPEQIKGTLTDERSDLFALGATLYTLVTGAPPPTAISRAHEIVCGRSDPLKLASNVSPHVTRQLDHALGAALALDPNRRPISAADFRGRLENHQYEDDTGERTRLRSRARLSAGDAPRDDGGKAGLSRQRSVDKIARETEAVPSAPHRHKVRLATPPSPLADLSQSKLEAKAKTLQSSLNETTKLLGELERAQSSARRGGTEAFGCLFVVFFGWQSLSRRNSPNHSVSSRSSSVSSPRAS